ncbi:MAG: sirohydrochlorin chelatase [Streptosporangiales bacterium]|nr:sirohydrochlorin chelatase [Streptosporangiales bacterium]
MRTLVAAAHGTRDPCGQATIHTLVDRVRALRPALRVRVGYVDVQEPSLEAVLAGCPTPVVVPVLLSTGQHVAVDIPRSVAWAAPDARIAPPLGPDPALARLLACRLRAAGITSGDAVVLASAGSSHPAARRAVMRAAGMLQACLGLPVLPAEASPARSNLEEAVAAARAVASGGVGVASYLLAPGFFASRIAAAPADVVTPPIGPDETVAHLVLRRYDVAAR